MSTQIPNNYRVLIVDDNDAIHQDYRKILGNGPSRDGLGLLEDALFGGSPTPQSPSRPVIQIDSAMQGQEGCAMVRKAREENQPYAVAFVDMRMPPGWDGLQTIREIWRADPDLNIVICTAFSDHSWSEIEAAAGDGDHLLVLKKPFEAIEVRRMVATLTAKWTLSARAKIKESELEELVSKRTTELHRAAMHDRLTGLPNRRLFNDRLTQAFELSRRQPNIHLAILFIDLDRFKWVNDSLGHEAGDLLLKGIGNRLANALRNCDSVGVNDSRDPVTARLGGDEFCVLLTGMTSDSDASLVAERILKELAKPFDILGHQVTTSASIGIAVASPDYQRAEDLVRDADTAMYRAKADGKGRSVPFDKTMHDQAVRRLMIESELHRAVEQNELVTYFQPVVSLETGQMTGAEALVRWQHPERGMIPPGEFISIAEETGYINVLGLVVLEAACRQLQDWKTRIPGLDLSISVNVSSKQLASRGFYPKVEFILFKTGLDPKSLILEITETVLVEATEQTSRNLQQIRDKGIRVYLDDFGTGYSSLGLLNKFHLDGLKIDRSFVDESTRVNHFAAIIQAIIGLAHSLGIEVVAEGVETTGQMALLQSLKCEKAQGYLFSCAVEASAFESLLMDKSKMPSIAKLAA